jgi:hypothetical protein
MSVYKVAFNEETKVATIFGVDGKLPEGSKEIGEFNSTATMPNPTDASIQHIHAMLYRAGVTNPQEVTVEREPVTEVIERQGLVPATETGETMAASITPTEHELAVGETIDIVDGSTKGYTFDIVEGADLVKLDKRNAEVTAQGPGTARIKVANEKEGIANEVVITVREADAPEGGPDSQNGSDAGEANSS